MSAADEQQREFEPGPYGAGDLLRTSQRSVAGVTTRPPHRCVPPVPPSPCGRHVGALWQCGCGHVWQFGRRVVTRRGFTTSFVWRRWGRAERRLRRGELLRLKGPTGRGHPAARPPTLPHPPPPPPAVRP
jgi:hypothetical protein